EEGCSLHPREEVVAGLDLLVVVAGEVAAQERGADAPVDPAQPVRAREEVGVDLPVRPLTVVREEHVAARHYQELPDERNAQLRAGGTHVRVEVVTAAHPELDWRPAPSEKAAVPGSPPLRFERVRRERQ